MELSSEDVEQIFNAAKQRYPEQAEFIYSQHRSLLNNDDRVKDLLSQLHEEIYLIDCVVIEPAWIWFLINSTMYGGLAYIGIAYCAHGWFGIDSLLFGDWFNPLFIGLVCFLVIIGLFILMMILERKVPCALGESRFDKAFLKLHAEIEALHQQIPAAKKEINVHIDGNNDGDIDIIQK